MMRRFIQAAPPGQTTTVLKSLRNLVQDDAAFMETAPALVMEHIVRHHVAVHGTQGHPDAFALTQECHVAHWAAELSAATKALIDGEGLGDAFLEFAFIHWDARQIALVDPLTSAAVAMEPLLPDAASETPVAAEDRLAVVGFAKLATAPPTGLGFTPKSLRVATIVALRDALAAELRKYAARRYETVGAGATVGVSPPLDVFVGDSSATALACGITASRVNDAACWEGRWSTDFTVAFSDESDSEGAALFTIGGNGAIASPKSCRCVGRTRVDFTYYEDGNVQMDSATPFDVTVECPSGWVADDADAAKAFVTATAGSMQAAPTAIAETVMQVARRIARALENSEDYLQDSIAETSRTATFTDDAMRPLRRKLPVTKQLFDFGSRSDSVTTREAIAKMAPAASAPHVADSHA
jgi:hypothetical protein